MISKNLLAFNKSQAARQSQLAALVAAPQRKFAGGGKKKPAMPATNTDFDVVLVGK
jgi:hypothetical protein